jgi:hypothetical protein
VATANSAVFPNRLDDYYSFNIRLGSAFLRRGSIAVFYQYTDNSSSQAGYTFSSNQAGLELGYKF